MRIWKTFIMTWSLKSLITEIYYLLNLFLIHKICFIFQCDYVDEFITAITRNAFPLLLFYHLVPIIHINFKTSFLIKQSEFVEKGRKKGRANYRADKMHFSSESLIESDVVALSDIHIPYLASPEAGSPSYLIIITPSKLHSANTPGTHPEAVSLHRSRCFELHPCSARSPSNPRYNRGFSIFTVLRFTRTRKTPRLSAAHRCGSTCSPFAVRAGNIAHSRDSRSIRGKLFDAKREILSLTPISLWHIPPLSKDRFARCETFLRHKSSWSLARNRERYLRKIFRDDRSVDERLRLVRYTDVISEYAIWVIATQMDRSRYCSTVCIKNISHPTTYLRQRRRSLPQMSLGDVKL